MLIYRDRHPDYPIQVTDSVMIQRYAEYKVRRKDFTSAIEERNKMRREFGETYWWYFDYQH